MELTAKEFRAIQLRRSVQDLQHILTILAADGELSVDLSEVDENDARNVVDDAEVEAARLFLAPVEPEEEFELTGEAELGDSLDGEAENEDENDEDQDSS